MGGGFSSLAASGLRTSKSRFTDYCAANAGKLDCGWQQVGGIDCAALDQTNFEASPIDPRVRTTVSIDPATPRLRSNPTARKTSPYQP